MALAQDSFGNFRKNVPSASVEPSAPMYAEITCQDSSINRSFDTVQVSEFPIPRSDDFSAARMTIELDLKKARLKKEHLERERRLVHEDFRVRIEVVDAEIVTAMAKLKGLLKRRTEQPTRSPIGNAIVQHQAAEPIVPNYQGYLYPNLGLDQHVDPVPDYRCSAHTANEINTRIPGIPPNGLSVETSIGFEQLRVLDCVSIRRVRMRRPWSETYEVVAPGENLVLFCVDVDVAVVHQIVCHRFEFIDMESKKVMTFQAGPNNFMELYMCGNLVSKVKKAATYFKPKLDVYDHQAGPVLKIKGSGSADHKDIFQVQNMLKTSVGLLDKRPAVPSLRYESDHAVLKFPLNLDVRYKAALIAANFLIAEGETLSMRKEKMATFTRQQIQATAAPDYY